MSDVSTFPLKGVKICWRIDNFSTVISRHIGGNNSIESRSFLLKNDLWSLGHSASYEDIRYGFPHKTYKFSIHSAATKRRTYKFHIRLENSDGYCLFEDDAVYVNSRLYQCVVDTLKYDEITFLAKDELDCVTFVCLAYSFSENLYSIGSKEVAEDERDVSTQTTSLESVATLSDNLKELFTSGNHADIKIKVGSREFLAHKFLLAARSSVLNSMFSTEMHENKSGVLYITDCAEDVFEGFLIFLYCGKLEDIRSDKIAGLYEIADKYDLQELKKECIKRMTIDMSMESVCDVLRVATLFEEKGLLQRATNFFISNAYEIINTSKWEIFLEDHPKIGNELFKKLLKCKK